MRTCLEKRVQQIEERMNPGGITTMVVCSVRIEQQKEDFQRIEEEFYATHGRQTGRALFLIDCFLEGDEEPEILEVRPWGKKGERANGH